MTQTHASPADMAAASTPIGGPARPARGDDASASGEDPRHAKRLARSAARLAAVQALYQLEMTGQSWREVLAEFETHRFGAVIEGATYREADRAHFRAVLENAVALQRDIDPVTNAALVESWPLTKVDPTLRAIFRCSGAEFFAMAGIPPRVTITEYVDVAKAFFLDDETPRFTNAVLDAMARRIRPGEMTPRAKES